jgi:hypothetical protein
MGLQRLHLIKHGTDRFELHGMNRKAGRIGLLSGSIGETCWVHC